MKNWSTDTRELSKNTDKFTKWRLEQQINFGLDGERLILADLKKFWNLLDIDPYKKRFLALFI